MGRLLLLDSSNLARRYYEGMSNRPYSVNSDGREVGAIIGWVNGLLRLVEQFHPTRVVAVFEEGRCKERVAVFPEYKQHRAARPPEFTEQLVPIRELTRELGVEISMVEGHEADDVIACLSVHWLEASPMHVAYIASSDKDFNALLTSNRIHLLRPGNGTTQWDEISGHHIREKFHLEPHQFVDYLALVGDASDGFPGVPGVGPKTATQLLHYYGDCGTLLKSLSSVTPLRVQELLREHVEVIERNLYLVNFLEVDVSLALEQPMGSYGEALNLLRVLKLPKTLSQVVEVKETWPFFPVSS